MSLPVAISASDSVTLYRDIVYGFRYVDSVPGRYNAVSYVGSNPAAGARLPKRRRSASSAECVRTPMAGAAVQLTPELFASDAFGLRIPELKSPTLAYERFYQQHGQIADKFR